MVMDPYMLIPESPPGPWMTEHEPKRKAAMRTPML
jgi:hypothetical protein